MKLTSSSRQLALIFAILALLSLLSGIGLGLWMALDPAIMPRLLRIHGVINVFGWLSFLMFGATYLILTLFARREARLGLGRLQVAAHLLGLGLLTVGYLRFETNLIQAGWLAYGVGAILFLPTMLGPKMAERPSVSPSLFAVNSGEELARLDRLARPLTMTGPLFLIVATLGLGLTSPASSLHQAFLDFGRLAWPILVALGVGYHLLPRFTGRIPNAAFLRPLLLLLLLGFFLRLAGLAWQTETMYQIGNILLGAALLWVARSWLQTLAPARAGLTLLRLSVLFLSVGALILVVGEWLPALAEYAVLHALLLGWLTSLAYGVAPRLFPGVLGRSVQNETAQWLPAWLHGSGVTLMISAFLFGSGPTWLLGGIRPFAWGASLVTAGVLVFLDRARLWLARS